MRCFTFQRWAITWRLHLIRIAAGTVLLAAGATGCGGPPDAGTPLQKIARGWDDYDAALYDDAERLFAAAARDTPETDEAHLQALYGQATTINLRRPGGNAGHARPIYLRVAALAPESDWAAWSLLALARAAAQPESGEAPALAPVIDAYQQVIDRFPSRRAGEEAVVFQQSARVWSPDRDEARKAAVVLERFVAEHPRSAVLGLAYQTLGSAYEISGEPDKAVAAMVKYYETYRVDSRNPKADYTSIYWGIAMLANYRAGDFATARRFYGLLITEYPSDRRVFTAKLAIREMDEIEARLRSASTAPVP